MEKKSIKVVVTRRNYYLEGEYCLSGRRHQKLGWGGGEGDEVSHPLPIPAPSSPRRFNLRYPSSKLFSVKGKKEIDCVFKSYLKPTKGALFQNGLRGVGALGGKS